MDLLGVVNSHPGLNKIIDAQFKRSKIKRYELVFLGDADKTLEFLNFDLPEIVIINFSDSAIPIDSIAKQVENDSWLHSFGIIGLFDPEKTNEEEILKTYKGLNILAVLDFHRVGSHIVKSVEIIDQNRQIIFQKELSDKLANGVAGSFFIENDPLAVSIYASLAAISLSQRGFISPDTKMYLQLALSELIINGVEHGNCEVSFEEKTKALNEGRSVVDLIAEKCKNPEIAKRRVFFEWDIQKTGSTFLIRDEGKGFDVKKLNRKIEEEGPFSLHGRGVRMATMLAEKLIYNDIGNEVTMVFKHSPSVTRVTPKGFTGEESIFPKRGDIIFREGESSDFLYYIASGRYSVYHKGRRVGLLDPADIFMGEMSFLLNNRRSASVRADSDGKLIKISRKSFVSVVREYPHYGIFLSKLLARKLVRANARNAEVVAAASGGKEQPAASDV
jgi:anti-sigma regulatory factor (Ser/Thr protein kinase)